MKKFKYLFILFILVVGCQKEKLTKDKFLEVAEFNGYIVEKNKTGYENYTYIQDIYYAINRENAYDIQFLELINEEYSERFFELNREDLAKSKTINSYVKQKSRSNYDLYHLETDDEYLLIIRNSANIIYIKAPIGYINEIEEFLQELDLEF